MESWELTKNSLGCSGVGVGERCWVGRKHLPQACCLGQPLLSLRFCTNIWGFFIFS